ncbi:MAG: ABC transporter permease [Chloroflexota bacterium]
MGTFIARRCLQSVVVLVGVSVISFALVHLSGDPINLLLPFDATPQQIADARRYWGLDEPLLVQYGRFFDRVVRGDLGVSMKHNQPVTLLIADRLPATAELAVAAMTLALVVAIPVGVLSATRPYSLADRFATVAALLGKSAPSFWIALLLVMVFAVNLGWFPATGRGSLSQLVLPSVTLALGAMATLTRLTRTSLLDELRMDYLRTARAKGLSEWATLVNHGLRNAWIPVITVAGLQFASLLGGAFVTESIFAWPGLGQLVVRAIYDRDLPLIQGATMFFAGLFVVMNLAVDTLYAVVDPRVRRA